MRIVGQKRPTLLPEEDGIRKGKGLSKDTVFNFKYGKSSEIIGNSLNNQNSPNLPPQPILS